jgi:hypothetical protein
MPDFLTIAITTTITLMIALATAIFAYARYRLEKLWDRKLQAYIDIIEAMHHMKRVVSLEIDAHIEGREISEEGYKEITAHWKSSNLTIMKFSDIASLIVSKEAEKFFLGFIKEIQNAGAGKDIYFDVIDEQYAIVERGLKIMVELAALDVKRRAWWRLA